MTEKEMKRTVIKMLVLRVVGLSLYFAAAFSALAGRANVAIWFFASGVWFSCMGYLVEMQGEIAELRDYVESHGKDDAE